MLYQIIKSEQDISVGHSGLKISLELPFIFDFQTLFLKHPYICSRNNHLIMESSDTRKSETPLIIRTDK